jgi:hypothetical protein
MPYGGIKVLEIPILVLSAGPTPKPVFKATYGLAFAGSYLAAFLLKEMVAEVLSNVQFLGPPELITFERICALVFAYHQHFTTRSKHSLKLTTRLIFSLVDTVPRAEPFMSQNFTLIKRPFSRNGKRF